MITGLSEAGRRVIYIDESTVPAGVKRVLTGSYLPTIIEDVKYRRWYDAKQIQSWHGSAFR